MLPHECTGFERGAAESQTLRDRKLTEVEKKKMRNVETQRENGLYSFSWSPESYKSLSAETKDWRLRIFITFTLLADFASSSVTNAMVNVKVMNILASCFLNQRFILEI